MVKTSIPRLHSYRPKGGNSSVTVLHTIPAHHQIMDPMRSILDAMTEAGESPAGYFAVVWDSEGCYRTAYDSYMQPSPITPALLPSWLYTVMMRILSADEAHNVFNHMFERVD